jgi:hypothetical protein
MEHSTHAVLPLNLLVAPAPRGGVAIASWIAQVAAAVIMGQTLFFKFSGAPEPVYIFTTLGVEPWGRFATAIFELIAVVLLLVPRTAAFGGVLTIGLMVGAIGSHLTKLGIVVKDDGGLLFWMGVVALVAGIVVAVTRRGQLAQLASRLLARR